MPRERQRPEEQKKGTRDRRANRTILLRTLVLMALFGIGAFIPLFGKLYAIQITEHENYQKRAIEQQTRDNAVSASRGRIIDSGGTILATSGTVYDVILSPTDFVKLQERWDKAFTDSETGRKKTEAKGYYDRPELEQVAAALGEILGIDPERAASRLAKNSSYEVLATRVETEIAEEIQKLISDMRLSNSVYTVPTTKRYYPKGSLAAQLIGWVNWKNDNKGAYGMEALYESELAGETGRVVTARNGDGTEMKYSFQEYYEATDGNDLHLTVDSTIQYYCERILEKGVEMFDVQNGGFVIAMDPKTGAIKAWANSPSYDLNDPWTITDPVLNHYLETVQNDPAAAEDAYNTALVQMQNRQWRNKAMNDSYEPGSTFKSMVLAAALEEGVISESSTYYCPGYYMVDDTKISCSKKEPGHGSQTLAQAVANSCNPAFMMIGQALGAEKFYNYLTDFGFLEKTGIDMQGEGNSIVWDRRTFTAASTQQNTYLATASFGQGFQATPIQLITAASAVINGGHLMQPYVMDSITDNQGNIIAQTEPTEVRQVISEETSERCRAILEGVVDGGTGKRAYVPGYRIGGKTGSSETVESRRGEDRTIVSFLGFAPADDPQIIVLLAYDAPKPVTPGNNLTAKGYGRPDGGRIDGRYSGPYGHRAQLQRVGALPHRCHRSQSDRPDRSGGQGGRRKRRLHRPHRGRGGYRYRPDPRGRRRHPQRQSDRPLSGTGKTRRSGGRPRCPGQDCRPGPGDFGPLWPLPKGGRRQQIYVLQCHCGKPVHQCGPQRRAGYRGGVSLLRQHHDRVSPTVPAGKPATE